MSERAVATAKKPEVKKTCSNFCRQNIGFNSSGSTVDMILQLQKTAGNRAVQKLIKSGVLQAKLRIGQPNDIYEQEADRVAEQFMRMPESKVQSEPEKEQDEEQIRTKPLDGQIMPLVQQQVEPDKEKEEELLQAKKASEKVYEVAPSIQASITDLNGSGQTLPESTRAFFEPRFGQDFSHVRVHTDFEAIESARRLNAQAYTIGSDLVFGAGQYAPETSKGKRLLAHELTHVVQQKRGGTYIPAPLPGSNLEREADRTASTCMDGGGFNVVYGSAPGLARQPRSLSQSLNPSSLSGEEIYHEINLIRQWLRDNPGVSPEHDQLMKVMQDLENEDWQQKEKQNPVQAPTSKTSKSAIQKGFRNVDITKLIDFELEQEYNTVQQRLLSGTSYPERQDDESYLKTIENEIEIRGNPERKKQESKQITVVNYDIFSLPSGQLKSGEEWKALIYNWEQLEQVYLDAANGNPRAKGVIQHLEITLDAIGEAIAEESYSLQCTAPIIQDFSKCIPNWSYFDFLRTDKPGSVRLRQIVADAYNEHAQKLGIRNEVVGHALTLLMAGVAVKGALGKATTTEVAGEGKALAGDGKAAVKEVVGGEQALTREGIATATYDNLDLPSLRKAACTDPEAAEVLRLRYKNMSDFELFQRFADEADETAAAIIRQKFPSNEAALKKILGKDYRPPHSATAVLRRGGRVVRYEKLESGHVADLPVEERALGFPRNRLATHTERWAIRRIDLRPGDFLEIRGQYDPCDSCIRAMSEAATRARATIKYWWQGGSMIFP